MSGDTTANRVRSPGGSSTMPPMPMPVEYSSHGAPLEEYELTRRNHHDQKVSTDICTAVDAQMVDLFAEEAADPQLKAGRDARRRAAWKIMLGNPTPDHLKMRWRVRLYCGHITTITRHAENHAPNLNGSWSKDCAECDAQGQVIVAWEPLGMKADPPPEVDPPRPTARKKAAAVAANDRVLTAEEVAAECGVSRQTVAKWCRRGELLGSKHGRSWFIRRSWLDQFLSPTNRDAAGPAAARGAAP